MTLQQYIEREYAEGKIDFVFRASVYKTPESKVEVKIYIHPSGKDGMTTPSGLVQDDTVIWPDTGGWWEAQ